jgi:hypothetical protein
MSKAAAIAVVAGGAALALSGDDAPKQTRDDIRKTIFGPIYNRTGGVYEGTPDPKYAPRSPWVGSNDDGWPQEVVDAVIARLKKKWAELSSELRRKACLALKDQFPDDPGIQTLDCGASDFQKILSVTAAAVALGVCGPGCSAVAIVAVAITGDSLESWLSDAWESFAHREGIGGPVEEALWRAKCIAAQNGNDEALLEILTFQEENGLAWCVEHGYPIGLKV